jgi:hypothetical protein
MVVVGVSYVPSFPILNDAFLTVESMIDKSFHRGYSLSEI